MKLIFAIILVMVTVFSVFRPNEPSCESSLQDTSKVSILIHSINHTSAENHQSPVHDHHQDQNHNCHLGHCTFVLVSEPAFNSNAVSDSISSLETNFELSDFISNLFRPPIA